MRQKSVDFTWSEYTWKPVAVSISVKADEIKKAADRMGATEQEYVALLEKAFG
jgi:hypothetical protein